MRISKSSRSYPLLNNEEWLRQQYCVEGKIMREIAALVGGCSPALVLHAMRRFGIESRDNKAAQNGRQTKPKEFPQLADKEWLQERRNEGLSGSQVAAIVGCSVSVACKAFREAGIPNVDWTDLDDATKSPFYGRKEMLRNETWLTEEFLIKRRTAKGIAVELCTTMYAVQSALYRFRIVKFVQRPTKKKDCALPQGVKRTQQGYLKQYIPDHQVAVERGMSSCIGS